MNITVSDQNLLVVTSTYSLDFSFIKPYVLLKGKNNVEWMKLFLGGGMSTTTAIDGFTGMNVPEHQTLGDKIIVTIKLNSHIWDSEVLTFECMEEAFSSYISVKGNGSITDLNYFGGNISASPVGNCFSSSEALFRSVFSPSPSKSERWVTPVYQPTRIGVTGSSYPGHNGWFFTPPPFCFAFNNNDAPVLEESIPHGEWMMVGLIAEKGANNFTNFKYSGEEFAFHFSLQYEGYAEIVGDFVSPKLVFIFDQKDPYSGLETYHGHLNHNVTNETLTKYDWWIRPIFCGWGAQFCLSEVEKGHAPNYAKQELYDQFLSQLETQGIKPGIITIDDKWQEKYGLNNVDTEKWPDLKGWIEKCHQNDQKVLLWLKAWDSEGLSPEFCITNVHGNALTIDPTNPKTEKLLREQVRTMLGKEGYNADGFKIDFTARTPSGPGLHRLGPEWGVELLHKLLKIIYDESKKVKEDALVVTHTSNAYFRDVTDMVRLNDVNCGAAVVPQMIHRAKIVSAACPDHLVDTDNWLINSIEEWRSYTLVQTTLGVPSLYYTTHVGEHPLSQSDFDLIKEVWGEYVRKIK